MFSVPLNPKLSEEQYTGYLRFLQEHKSYIRDVYFTCRIPPFTQDAMGHIFATDGSGAIEDAFYVQEATGVKISATFNDIQVRPDLTNLETLITSLRPLYDRGLRSATIPHTQWVMTGRLQEEFPELELKNTVLKPVNNAAQLAKQAEAGFHYINIDRNLVRNRDELVKIGKVKAKSNITVALLGNEGCTGNCPIMPEHYHFNATRKGPNFFQEITNSCLKWSKEDPAKVLKLAVIQPWKEDWDELLQFIDVFKMHGRDVVEITAMTIDIICRYKEGAPILYDDYDSFMDRNNLAGKPMQAWRRFIKNCKFDCWDCTKCDDLIKTKTTINPKRP